MPSNVKIITPDVIEILDGKILATSPHSQLTVIAGEDYDSVLTKITARTPTLPEKQALDASLSPSAGNPYLTQNDLNALLDAKIPWITIGLPGSGSDFEGSDETAFSAAFLGGGDWFQVREGTYTFTSTLTVPANVRLTGTSAASTRIEGNFVGSVIELQSGSYLGFISIEQQAVGESAVEASSDSFLENVIVESTSTGKTIDASSGSALKVFECVFQNGNFDLSGNSGSVVHGCLFDVPVGNAVDIVSSSNISVTSSIFSTGQIYIDTSSDIRVVANHLAGGVTINASTALLRANTPNTVNNEADDFANLLSYIGSPSITTVDPPFANNYGGPPGEDLTARASSLDLLVQWRYEERNFQLVADTEVTILTWDPASNLLSTSGILRLYSSHRSSYWEIPTITTLNIPNNSALYYVLDRSLNASPITLTPTVGTLGSIPNNRDNRQVYVLAFALGNTLWYRGGGGTRFPGTANQTGEYFVDGSSKSFLDYVGAADYNDYDPSYSNNFSGVNGESLTVRAGKTDTLIKRLFEYSNHGIHLSDGGSVYVEPGSGSTYEVFLDGTWYIAFPQVAGRITAPTQSWELEDGELVYFELDQGGLAGVDIPITSSAIVASGSLPLPDAYPLGTKYFVFARRVGSSVYLWDDTELPVGGKFPQPIGHEVVPTALPVTLSENFEWDGADFLWESLSVAVSTGIPLTHNYIPDQTTASPGLTDLAEGEGLVITFSWNATPTPPRAVTIQKQTLPVSLNQNQFLWVQRRNNHLIFS